MLLALKQCIYNSQLLERDSTRVMEEWRNYDIRHNIIINAEVFNLLGLPADPWNTYNKSPVLIWLILAYACGNNVADFIFFDGNIRITGKDYMMEKF